MANDKTDQNDESADLEKPEALAEGDDVTREAPGKETPLNDNTKDNKNRRGLIITASVLGFLAIGLLGAAIGVAVTGSRYVSNRSDDFGMMGNSVRFESRGYGAGYGRYVSTQVNNDSVSTTVYNYQTGVVTAVNGDNIVIAGNGKSTKITTSSSTKYTNDVKPSVNDTVTVMGTTVDSNVTATEIDVLNK